jgi:tetratricopeptide (TPR) repeat protein
MVMSIKRLPLGIILVFAIGCGGGTMSESQLKNAQGSFEQAAMMEADGKHAEALPLIEAAMSKGGLNPDQLSEAYLIRSRCYSLANKTDMAEKDIASAEQGSPNPASLSFTKAILLAKQSKAAESKAEFAKAVKINPKLKMPN